MSKYGKINVDVKKHYTSDQINALAEENGLSYDECESILKEMLYRKQYNVLRNKDPQVKAKRKAYNKKRHQLAKALRNAL